MRDGRASLSFLMHSNVVFDKREGFFTSATPHYCFPVSHFVTLRFEEKIRGNVSIDRPTVTSKIDFILTGFFSDIDSTVGEIQTFGANKWSAGG